MANDGGTTALIEQAMADKLATIQFNGKSLFKKTEPWNYQISADQGGIESIQKFAPCAFPKFTPPTDSTIEGGDLSQKYRFGILICQHSKEAGVARIGNTNIPGAASLIRDLVISAIEDWHPGEGFDCDDFHFDGDELELETPYIYALIIYFKTNRITI